MASDADGKSSESRGGIDEALKRWAEGDHESAMTLLSALAERFPDRASVIGVLAGRHYLRGEWDLAAKWFARTTAISPTSEMGSLGLFHSLWRSGKRDDAFNEAARFVRCGGRSAEYDRLIREWNESDDDHA